MCFLLKIDSGSLRSVWMVPSLWWILHLSGHHVGERILATLVARTEEEVGVEGHQRPGGFLSSRMGESARKQ